MAQHDYVIANGTGAAVRSDLNNALAAIVSQNSGATAPSTTYAYMPWADTTTGLFKIRNAANNGWITLYELDGTFSIEAGSASSPGLYFTGDSNTGIYSPGADQFAVATSGTGRLFVDSSGRVGLGTNSPQANLDVRGTGSASVEILRVGDGTKYLGLGTEGTNYSWIQSFAATPLYINPQGNNTILNSGGGNVGIGTTGPGATLDVSGTVNFKPATGYNALFQQSSSTLRINYLNDAGSANVSASYRATDFAWQKGDGGEVVRIDSSGRLLVGTSTWSSVATSVLQGNSTDGATGPGYLTISRGLAPGSIGAGNTIGVISFTANNAGAFALIVCEGDAAAGTNDYPGRLVFSTTADGASSPTERMRIDSAGLVKISNGNATFIELFNTGGYSGFHALDGTAYTIGQNSNDRALRIGSGSGWGTTGVNLAAGGTSWGTYSDERLKEDIVELNGCLEQISGIRCVTYRLKDVDDVDSKKRLGVIAQDLEGKFDEALNASRRSEDDENEYLSVQYADLVPVLIKSLQEAKQRIETLEAKVAALEAS